MQRLVSARSGGLSLIESLVALAVVGVAMAGAFLALSRAEDWSHQARLDTAASAVLRREVEGLMAAPVPRAPEDGAAWEPGERPPEPVSLVIDGAVGVAAAGRLLTTVTDIERVESDRELRLRRAVVAVEYLHRGRVRTLQRTVVRAVQG